MQEFILLVVTVLSGSVAAAAGNGVKNKMEGHDAFKSAMIGLAAGIVAGIVGWLALT